MLRSTKLVLFEAEAATERVRRGEREELTSMGTRAKSLPPPFSTWR